MTMVTLSESATAVGDVTRTVPMGVGSECVATTTVRPGTPLNVAVVAGVNGPPRSSTECQCIAAVGRLNPPVTLAAATTHVSTAWASSQRYVVPAVRQPLGGRGCGVCVGRRGPVVPVSAPTAGLGPRKQGPDGRGGVRHVEAIGREQWQHGTGADKQREVGEGGCDRHCGPPRVEHRAVPLHPPGGRRSPHRRQPHGHVDRTCRRVGRNGVDHRPDQHVVADHVEVLVGVAPGVGRVGEEVHRPDRRQPSLERRCREGVEDWGEPGAEDHRLFDLWEAREEPVPAGRVGIAAVRPPHRRHRPELRPPGVELGPGVAVEPADVVRPVRKEDVGRRLGYVDLGLQRGPGRASVAREAAAVPVLPQAGVPRHDEWPVVRSVGTKLERRRVEIGRCEQIIGGDPEPSRGGPLPEPPVGPPPVRPRPCRRLADGVSREQVLEHGRHRRGAAQVERDRLPARGVPPCSGGDVGVLGLADVNPEKVVRVQNELERAVGRWSDCGRPVPSVDRRNICPWVGEELGIPVVGVVGGAPRVLLGVRAVPPTVHLQHVERERVVLKPGENFRLDRHLRVRLVVRPPHPKRGLRWDGNRPRQPAKVGDARAVVQPASEKVPVGGERVVGRGAASIGEGVDHGALPRNRAVGSVALENRGVALSSTRVQPSRERRPGPSDPGMDDGDTSFQLDMVPPRLPLGVSPGCHTMPSIALSAMERVLRVRTGDVGTGGLGGDGGDGGDGGAGGRTIPTTRPARGLVPCTADSSQQLRSRDGGLAVPSA
eukprot:m.264949 g.264949  ORF g.264949 m.264949 type:complete len:770 (+) comp26734_c0_seq2:1975-4284(+)